MSWKAFLAGAAMAMLAVLPAQAQRGGGPGDWELLGEEKVGVGGDRDVVQIQKDEGFYRERQYRRLRLVVTGGEVEVRSASLIYMNGHSEPLGFTGRIVPGREIDIDLRGERSYIKAIAFDYSSRFSFSFGSGGIRLGAATMRVYGDPVRRGLPPAPVRSANSSDSFETIGDARFQRGDGRVNVAVGRKEGRFEKIRVRYNGEGGSSVRIRELIVRFSNGEEQRLNVDTSINSGTTSPPIDLDGRQRFIERVTIVLDDRRAPGGLFTVQGEQYASSGGGRSAEPAPSGRRANWDLLGRQTIGFGTDRDVIRVEQNESWYRDKGFDKLHFTAENNDVSMLEIRVVYMNGHQENYRVDRTIPAGGDLVVDLPGSRSYIRQIEMTYRSRRGFDGRSVVSVYGERARR